MFRAKILVLMTFSAFSPTLGLGLDPKFDRVVHFDPWEDKMSLQTRESIDMGARDIRSYHGLCANNPIKPLHQTMMQQEGARVSHAKALNSTQCTNDASGKTKKVMFVHVPKTGGESVEAAFHLVKNHKLADSRHDEFFNKKGMKRDDVFIISVIRNPFSRTWSWFKFCVHGYRGVGVGPAQECNAATNLVLDLQNLDKLNEITVREAFSTWLSLLDQNEGHAFNGGGKPWRKWRLWTPMSEWLVDRDTNTILPDYVIRFETYQQDWDNMCECLGLRAALPHENDSGSEAGLQAGVELRTAHLLSSLDFRDVYSDKSEAIVLQWFADDFTRFAYSQNPKAG